MNVHYFSPTAKMFAQIDRQMFHSIQIFESVKEMHPAHMYQRYVSIPLYWSFRTIWYTTCNKIVQFKDVQYIWQAFLKQVFLQHAFQAIQMDYIVPGDMLEKCMAFSE